MNRSRPRELRDRLDTIMRAGPGESARYGVLGARAGRRRWVLCALLAALGGSSCQTGLPAKRLRDARAAVVQAREAGAYLCAPRELALAQAHVEFAETEEIHGEVERGLFHLGEAELNARAARRLSRSGCGRRGVAPGSAQALSDRDGDGVVDRVDLCPDEPEDRDNHLDQDGCAEGGDARPSPEGGVEGAACAAASSDPEGRNAGAVCPDSDGNVHLNGSDEICAPEHGGEARAPCRSGRYAGIELRDNAVILRDPVQFVGRDAALQASSRLLLSALARWLQERPGVTIEVQGHLDSRGDAGDNLRLSALRAEAVAALLVELGVAEARLTARGYGETRPLESNRTSQGRTLNRRIEFVRTDSTH